MGGLRCHFAETLVTGLGPRIIRCSLQFSSICLIQIIIYFLQPFLRLLLQLNR